MLIPTIALVAAITIVLLFPITAYIPIIGLAIYTSVTMS